MDNPDFQKKAEVKGGYKFLVLIIATDLERTVKEIR